MVTKRDLLERENEVTHLIKWWVSRSKLRYHRVRKYGTLNDFINDVWVRLLSSFTDEKQVKCSLSTVVIHSCEWEAVSLKRTGGEKTWVARERIRKAEDLQEDHRIENKNNEQIIEFVANKERDETIAVLLRSLTWRESVIVRARLGLLSEREMTLKTIGRRLNISQERVRQIWDKGIKKLQHHSRAVKLLPFLGLGELHQQSHQQIASKKVKQLKKTEYGRVLLDELMID